MSKPVQSPSRDTDAYQDSIRYYRAGTPAAQAIQDFILARFNKAERLDRVYCCNIRGMFGYLTPRVDRNGLIVFAFYRRDPEAKVPRTRRGKKRFPIAQRPIFFTAPEVWAHLNGYHGLYLKPAAYAVWKEKLEADAQVAIEAIQPRYALPWVPAPDAVDEHDRDKYEERWSAFERVLGKRLISPYRRLMYRVWTFFVKRWRETSRTTTSGLPCCVKTADVYLARILDTSRSAIGRAINDLDHLGLVQAAIYERSGKANKKGIYWYLPGTGQPPQRRTRHPGITAYDTHACMRKFIRACVDGWPDTMPQNARPAVGRSARTDLLPGLMEPLQ